MFSNSVFDFYLFYISRSSPVQRGDDIARQKRYRDTTRAKPRERRAPITGSPGEPTRRGATRGRITGTMIPRSVNIRDRRYIRSLPRTSVPFPFLRRPASSMTEHACASRARIIIIFVISWHSARRAHQSENRINSTVTFTPKFKIRREEGPVPPRGPSNTI